MKIFAIVVSKQPSRFLPLVMKLIPLIMGQLRKFKKLWKSGVWGDQFLHVAGGEES
jgi:hypothetical protein